MRLFPRIFSRGREKEPSQTEKATAVIDPLDTMAWQRVVANGGVCEASVAGAGNRREDVRKLVFHALKGGDFLGVDNALAMLGENISPEIWKQIGDSFLARGEYREAVESFRRAGDQEGPKRAMADLRAGMINGQSRTNMRYFVEIFSMVEGRPLSVQEKTAMADEAFDIGNLRQAEYIYYEIFERTPHVARRLGDIEMHKQTEAKSEYAAAHLENAVAFYKEARYEEGLRCIAEYYASHSNLEGIIDICSFLGEKPDISWCRKITAQFEDLIMVARFLKKIGYPDEAIRLGEQCMAKGNLNDALVCFRIVDYLAGLRKVGDAYRKAGKFCMADEVYREIRYEPIDPVFYEALAREFIQRAQIQKAQQAFKRALQIAGTRQSDEPSGQTPPDTPSIKPENPLN